PPWWFKSVHSQRRVDRADDAHPADTVIYPISNYPSGRALHTFEPWNRTSGAIRINWYHRTRFGHTGTRVQLRRVWSHHPLRLPRRADHTRCSEAAHRLLAGPAPDRHDRNLRAALRTAPDRHVRGGRTGVGGHADRCGDRFGG